MEKYKTSRYNYFVDYENKKLLINGLKGNGFCMTQSEYEELLSLLENTNEFEKKFPNDFKLLYEKGFFIEADFDEVSYIKLRNRQQTFLDKSYRLMINPTLECNFSCWYCFEDHPKGHMSKKTQMKLKRHIKYMVEIEKITSLKLDWFGGEPLLYFYDIIYSIAKYAQKICHKNNIPCYCQMTTNGYLIDEKMMTYLNEIQNYFFQITLDGDKERHNKIRNVQGNPTFDIINKNVNLLCENINNVRVILRINYDEKTLLSDAVYSILDQIKEENRNKVVINMQRVWQTYKGDKEMPENESLIKFIEKSKAKGFKNVTNGANIVFGNTHSCYVCKYNFVNINYDGKVYKCSARNYVDDYVIGELMDKGFINWDIKKISKMYANATFENPLCLECKYLPICNGPCPQSLAEFEGSNIQAICRLNNMEYSFEKQLIDSYETVHFKK